MNSYLKDSGEKAPSPLPNSTERRPLPPPRTKKLPPTPGQVQTPLPIEVSSIDLPILPGRPKTKEKLDHVVSEKTEISSSSPNDKIQHLNSVRNTINIGKLDKKPPLPMRKVEPGTTPKPVVDNRDSHDSDTLIKSPRTGDETKQKTAPPRPVSKIILKGDLQEVMHIATSTPTPIKEKLDTPLPMERDDRRTSVMRLPPQQSFTAKKDLKRAGFVIYVPEVEGEVETIKDEKTLEKAKKRGFTLSPELLEAFNKKYARPSKQEDKAVRVLQRIAHRLHARKFYKNLVSVDYTRRRIAVELLETEQAYVNDMKVLVQVYVKTFREHVKGEKPLITANEVQNIFADVEVIVGFGDHFVKGLEEVLKNYDRFTTNIADVIVGIAPFFKTYTRYCNNYEKASAIITRNRNMNPEFKAFLLALDKDERTNKLGLNSYLIKPIQRIPRYRLLLQDYIKNTWPEHPHYKKIEDALEKVKEVALHLNEAVRDIEESQKLTEIQSQFVGKINLVESHRKPIKNGFITLLDARGSQVYIHLFNDCLVYSSGTIGAFQFKGKFDFSISIVYDYVGEDKEYKFSIKTIDDELVCVCPSIQVKNEWMKKVYHQIELFKTERKESNKSEVTLQDDTATTFSVAMSEENIEVSIEESIRTMKEGQNLLKYCRNTRPHFRRFALTEDELTLMWGSPNKNTTDSKVDVKHIKRLLLGQKTAIFARYPNPDIEELSFSILYENRTLDIVCKDKREFLTWVNGIQYLCGRPHRSEPEFPSDKKQTNVLQSSAEENKKFKESFAQIGDAYLWGQGTRGALGNGKNDDNILPVILKDFLYLDVDLIFCEAGAGCALTTAGEMFSWGANDCGRLGHGDELDRLLPTLVKPLQGHKIVQIAMGSTHTLVLEDSGTLWGFGGNKYGQLGVGNFDEKKVKPMILTFWKGKKIRSIAAGSFHSCVILDDGLVYMFGRGEDAQLGLGDKNNVENPTLLELDKKGFQGALGSWHSLILMETGELYSFGSETYGQTGHSRISNTNYCLFPKQIESLKDKRVVQISAGSAHNAIIVDKGDIYSWGGSNYGQCGHGKKDTLSKPKLVVELVGDQYKAKQVVCGTNHTLALMHSGKVFGWGAGTYGRLGISSEDDKYSPQLIELFVDKVVRYIAAGGCNSGAVAAHQWVPDKDAKDCMQCRGSFTFFNRRHHCRNCGGLYCGNCTSKKIILLRFGFDAPVRVCDNCYQILSKK